MIFGTVTKILVTGGRDFNDRLRVNAILEKALVDFVSICVIQGGAKGADRLAKEWALSRGVPCITVDAAWDALGKSAGSVRNRWMVDICEPAFVLAFPGGIGTANMVKYAVSKKITVYAV